MNPRKRSLVLHQSARARTARSQAQPQIKTTELRTPLAHEAGDNTACHTASALIGNRQPIEEAS